MMRAVVLLAVLGGVAGQLAGGNQVGAKYVGGAPRLTGGNCGDGTLVNVHYDVIASTQSATTGGFGVPQVPTQPYGVIYKQDVPVPALTNNPATTGGSSGFGGQTQLVSTVPCNEPTDNDVLVTPFPLQVGSSSFNLTDRYQISVQDLMADLCADVDGGIRTMRAVCFAIKAGQTGSSLALCGSFTRTGNAGFSPLTLDGLNNGKSYEVRAIAVDDFGNVGPPGSSVFGTPQKEYSFLDLQQGSNYGFSGCTQSGGGAAAMVLAAFGVRSLLRRRKSKDSMRKT